MASSQPVRAFGVFCDRYDAEGALNELKGTGFPMSQVSVVNREPEQPEFDASNQAENQAQEGTTLGAIAGGTVGGALGLAVGLGTIAAIPGVGPLALIGGAAVAMATTLTSSVIDATAGGLLGALVGYGIPEEQATVYRDRIHQGDYFVMIDGSEAEVQQAAAILRLWNIQEFKMYRTPTLP